MWNAFYRKEQYRYYEDRLSGSDLAIIGGGKLLQDNNFDFPLKIFGVCECARNLRIPTVFYACGVGQYWSAEATRLFEQAFDGAMYICLRDKESLKYLRNNMGRVPESKVRIVMDPAVCIAEALDITPTCGKRVGIGVISSDAIRRHAPHLADCCEEKLLSYFTGLAHRLMDAGRYVEFFCNGSQEDRCFLTALEASMGKTDCRVRFAEPATTHLELVVQISKYSHVIAARLHACVTSYSLNIPTLGIAWDHKVAAFFAEVGMERNVITISQESVNGIVALLDAAERRLNPMQTDSYKAKARDDLKALLAGCGL